MDLSLIALSAIVVSNVCSMMGFGFLAVIPHKKNFTFLLVSNLMILLLSVASSALYYLLYNFVFLPFECTELALFTTTVIVLLLDFAGLCLLKAFSKESYFHYEKNFMFVVHAVVVIGMLFASNVALDFLPYIFSIVMQFVGLFVVNIIFFALNHKINNKSMPEHIRALSPQLVILSVVALICFLVSGLVI